MRRSHYSQGFTIISSTLEANVMNGAQVTMSGVLTQSAIVYSAC